MPLTSGGPKMVGSPERSLAADIDTVVAPIANVVGMVLHPLAYIEEAIDERVDSAKGYVRDSSAAARDAARESSLEAARGVHDWFTR